MKYHHIPSIVVAVLATVAPVNAQQSTNPVPQPPAAPPTPVQKPDLVYGTVIQVIKGDGKTTEDGLLCFVIDTTGASSKTVVFLVGHPKYADKVDGDRVSVNAERIGSFKYIATDQSEKTVRKLRYVSNIDERM